MELRVLGPLEIHADDGTVSMPTGHTGHILVAFAHSTGRRLSVERLSWVLWGDYPPATARASIQVYVAKIRKILAAASSNGTSLIETMPNGYRLDPSGLSLDTTRFRALAQEGRRLPEPLQTHQMTEALALWRGRPYAPWTDDDCFSGDADALEELRLGLEEDLVDAELALGRHAEQIGELRTLVDAAPLRERRWRQLMLALYRCDRRAEALRTYRQLHTLLADELGIEPGPDATGLEESILFDDATLLHAGDVRPSGRRSTPLPEPGTSLVGRDRDLVEVADLLAHHPLVTLTGPGGVGKTRLAIEVARSSDAESTGQPVFVDLCDITDPDEVFGAVAEALGCSTSERDSSAGTDGQVIAQASSMDAVVILDSCEHILEPVGRAVDLLHASCPSVRIVATSLEPLDLGYEAVYPVRPLAVPHPTATPEQAAQVEAVRLFSVRAEQRAAGFELSNSNVVAIGQICRRLEGLPLALELAASALGASTPAQLAEELEHSLAPLSRGQRGAIARHQTLAATVEWSYQRLDDGLRRLLRRLAVFHDGWTLEGAQAITDFENVGPEAIRDDLRRLVSRSLVEFPLQGVEPRYRFLEPIRHVARDLCDDAGELDAVRRRHADYFRSAAGEAMVVRSGTDQAMWHLHFDAERPNYRAAIGWALENNDCDYLVSIIPAISRFWFTRDIDENHAGLMQRSLDLCGHSSPEPNSPLLLYGAQMAIADGDATLAEHRLDQFSETRPIDGDPNAQLYWHVRGNLSGFGHGDPTAALSSFETAVDIGEKVDSPRMLGSLSLLGYMKARTLDTRGARDAVRRMGEREEQSPIRFKIAVDQILGTVALLGEDQTEAVPRLRRSLDAIRDIGRVAAIPRAAIHLGWALLEDGEITETALLAETALESVHQPMGWQHAGLLNLLGACALRSDEPDVALALFGGSVDSSRFGPTYDMLAIGLFGLSASLGAVDRDLPAMRAFVAADTLREAHRIVVPPCQDKRIDELRISLDETLTAEQRTDIETEVTEAGVPAIVSDLRSLVP